MYAGVSWCRAAVLYGRALMGKTHKWGIKLAVAVMVSLSAAMPLAAKQQASPTRSSGLIAAGTKWQTPYTVIDSGRDGPTVLVTAGIHGNEPASAEAAQQISHWSISRGKLIVAPRCNAPGLAANDRYLPGEPTATRDPNRNFPKSADNEARTDLCKALWAFAKSCKPDWHVDLHEGTGFRGAGSKSVGFSIIHFRKSKASPVVAKMLKAVNATVSDAKRKFVLLGPPADGSLARAMARQLGAQSFIVETTTHEIVDGKSKPRTRAVRVRQHRIMFHVLLAELKMAACDSRRMVPPRAADTPPAGPLRVAVYNGPGTGNKALATARAVLDRQKDFALAVPVGPEDISDGALDQFDLVVFPGGSGSKQAAAIGKDGHHAVRKFIRGGGGYVGICAGAYLATYKYSWGLKVIDARTVDSKHWNRGNGMVKVELTDAGRKILGGPARQMDIYYAQGPLLAPAKADDLPDYQALAHYRTEIAKNGAPTGVMADTPAVIGATFGKGRVICFSPHFEKPQSEKGADALVRRGIQWAAGPQDAAAAKAPTRPQRQSPRAPRRGVPAEATIPRATRPRGAEPAGFFCCDVSYRLGSVNARSHLLTPSVSGDIEVVAFLLEFASGLGLRLPLLLAQGQVRAVQETVLSVAPGVDDDGRLGQQALLDDVDVVAARLAQPAAHAFPVVRYPRRAVSGVGDGPALGVQFGYADEIDGPVLGDATFLFANVTGPASGVGQAGAFVHHGQTHPGDTLFLERQCPDGAGGTDLPAVGACLVAARPVGHHVRRPQPVEAGAQPQRLQHVERARLDAQAAADAHPTEVLLRHAARRPDNRGLRSRSGGENRRAAQHGAAGAEPSCKHGAARVVHRCRRQRTVDRL